MANASKKTKKSADKKGSDKVGPTINIPQIPPIEIPIKITIHIEVRQDGREPEMPSGMAAIAPERQPAQPDPNFDYLITADGITVERLSINGTSIINPGESGRVFAPVDIETIQVMVDATQVNPVGSGTLQLQFFGKDVFTSPQEFEFQSSGGGGLNLTNVPLPL